jgi:hypothetical protein
VQFFSGYPEFQSIIKLHFRGHHDGIGPFGGRFQGQKVVNLVGEAL